MLSQSRSITLETPARQEFFDVTQQLDDFVRESGVNAGVAVAYSPHTSCCVLLQEESEDVTYYGTQLLLQDTLNVLARIAPPTRHEGQYLHPGPIHIPNASHLLDSWTLGGGTGCGREACARRVWACVLWRPRLRPPTHSHRPLPDTRRMTVLVYAVDLGTTNLKVVLYDDRLRRLAIASVPALYTRLGARVEFDPDSVFERVLGLIARCAADGTARASQEAVIVITGQAESLVLADDNGTAIRPGISWLDDRATAETVELGERFGADEAFSITGEPFASSTWPAAKLRGLRRHEPETLEAARSVLMIKDYLIGCFTGTAVGELTMRGFTYLWDVQGGGYWTEMLEHCGVSGKLPEVVPAGVDLGLVASGVAERLPKAQGYRINAGALDHFCAM